MSNTQQPPPPPLDAPPPNAPAQHVPSLPVSVSVPAEQPLLLTIRFSAALPDLELDIPRPRSTTVVSLKHTIRTRLAEPNSQRRLRFIHGGKILPDAAVLSSVLRAPLPPPPPPPRYGREHHQQEGQGGAGIEDDHDGYVAGRPGWGGSGNGKGKATMGKGKSVPGRPHPHQRIYVNCSIGDSLTSAELAEEAAAAAAPPSSSTTSSGVGDKKAAQTTGGAGAGAGTGTVRSYFSDVHAILLGDIGPFLPAEDRSDRTCQFQKS